MASVGAKQATAIIRSWQHAFPPSAPNIMKVMREQKLRPYLWTKQGNHRFPATTHNYAKVIYVVEGTVEVYLTESNKLATLRVGDSITLAAGLKYALWLGPRGAICAE
ncbi:MAG: cupin domain-containing protein, partial [Anaerolineae bacterium]|nr:cupin domain-containing protein [Anaerolineae bacterium]MDW8173567.1 cupin domain-containing protein [Anaerolineae bacterium]